MKKLLITNIIFVFVLLLSIKTNAQIANWSQTSGANFPTNNVGQINGMTRISQLKHHPTDSLKMYAVTAEGGFFTTTDKGNNWTVKAGTENLTGSCASLCIDYTNEQNVLLGTGDANYYSNGSGILKSTDGGTTFNTTSLTNCLVVHIIQNPLNASQYIAATNKGIYKSTNSGANWTAKTSTSLQFVDMRMNLGTNSQTLYACTKDNNPRLYKSYDFGDSWTELTPGFTYATTYTTGGARIGLTPADTSVVYYEMIGGGGMIYKSNDGGANFTLKKTEGFPYITFYDQNGPSSGLTGQGNYNNCIWVDRTNPSKLWLQSHNTWYSTDDGATWTQLTHWASKVHTDMHQIEQAPFNNNLLITCSDGGVWFSTDGGNNWTPKTNGIGAFEIANNAGISAMTDKNFVSIGTQDNARLYGTAAGWFTISGGDDYAKRVADFNGFIYYDGVNRQANLVGSSSTYGLPTNNWNAFAFNRTNVNLGFMGVNDIWRTTNLSNATPTWTQISTFNSAISSMHSCIADPNILYVLLTNGSVYVSTNALSGTPAFNLYAVGGTASSTGSIVAMANNASIVYVQENNKVYRSADGGQTWSNITYNLPNVNHRRIITEQYGGTTELVFVGTNNAVYYKKAGQTTWTNYSTNLPGRRSPTEISMYDNGTNLSKLRYATYGRSMWETKFGNLRELSASFDAAQTYYCTPGQTVQFRDQSIGNVTSWSWSFPGGSPSTSTSQNPTVTYAVGGIYSATLTVSDGVTSSNFTMTNYITVLAAAPKANTGCTLSSNSNLSNGFGIGISNFSLGTISSITSSNDGYYNDYSCSQYTYLTSGSTYNATITTGTTNSEGAQVYIDWNDNGNLESTEAVITYPANTSGTRTLSFTVPTSGVVLNKGLRLRVLSRFASTPTNACNTSTYGQAEDYTVYVQPVMSAVLSNGSGASNICGSGSANLKVTISGGSSPYTVVINDGTNNQTIASYTSGSNISVSPTATSTYGVVSVMDNAYYFINGSGSATVTVNQPSVNAPQTATSCNSYTWSLNGQTYTTSGTKTATYTNIYGCDSSYTLNLTINTATASTTTTSAIGNYTWNGVTYTTSGTYTKTGLMNSKGCDSTATLILTITAACVNTSSTTSISACNSYTWNSVTYTTSGTYTRTFVGGNSNGCDSTATLNLTINALTSSTTSISSCNSYTWNGTTYTTSGTYTRTFVGGNSNGCDSTATLHLTINAPTSSTTSISSCNSYTWNGTTYTTSGTYTRTFVGGNINGCDSTATLNLTISANYAITASAGINGSINPNGIVNVCNGASQVYTFIANAGYYIANVTVDGNNIGAVSSYTFNNVSANHTIAVSFSAICSNTTSTTNVSICSSAIPYSWNGNSYSSTGNYVVHLTNTAGCDSAATLNLTVKAATTSITNLNICSSALPYSWNGNSYSAAGTYTVHLANAVGCDSAATLNLTVANGSNATAPTITAQGATSICLNSSVTLCPTTFGYSNYQWYRNGVAILQNGYGACLTVDTSKLGSLSLSVSNDGNCWSQQSNSILVTTTSLPTTPSISASGSTNLCSGSSVVLTSSVTSGNQWYKDGIVISGETSSSYTAYTSGTYTVVVTNCAGSTTSSGLNITSSSSITVAVISASSNNICLGSTSVLSCSTPAGVWSSNNTSVATINSLGVVTPISAGTAIISYTVTVGACSGSSTYTINVLSSSVSTPIIAATGGAVLGSTAICGNGTLQLCPQTFGYSNYQWYKDGMPYATTSCIRVNTAGAYTLAATNGSGCLSSQSLPANVTVNAIPTVVATTGPTSVCVGYSITLSNLSTIPSGGTGVWSSVAGRANITNATGVVTGTSAGTATMVYTLTSSVGCKASTNYNVSVYAIPATPTIAFAPNTTGISSSGGYCTNKTFTLLGTPIGGTWNATGAFSINSGGVVTTSSTPGSGSVTYAYVNVCPASRTIPANVVNCGSKGVVTNNANSNSSFIIYPNPTHSLLNIKIDKLVGSGNIVVTDLYGKIIKKISIIKGVNTIDVSLFAKGMYLVSVISEQGKQVQKVIVE